MKRIHGLINLTTVRGDAYAECACGTRTYGDTEDEAFEDHTRHKISAWMKEPDE